MSSLDLDIFPKGMLLELLSADLSGGKPLIADKYEFEDMKSHLSSAKSHLEVSKNSFDLANILYGRLDSDISILLAYVVASRIQNIKLRKKAFILIENYLSKNGLSLFGDRFPLIG